MFIKFHIKSFTLLSFLIYFNILNAEDLRNRPDQGNLFSYLKAADACINVSDIPLAVKNLENAKKHITEETPPVISYKIYNSLGVCYSKSYMLMAANRAYHKALKIITKTDDIDQLKATVSNLGALEIRLGNYLKAKTYLLLAFKINSKLQEPQPTELLNNLGSVYFYTGDYKKASKFHREALDSDIGKNLTAIIIGNLAADLMVENQTGEGVRIIRDFFNKVNNAESKNLPLQVKLAYLYAINGDLKNASIWADKLEKHIATLSPLSKSLLFQTRAEISKKQQNFKEEALLKEKSLNIIKSSQGIVSSIHDQFLFKKANMWRYNMIADAWARAGESKKAMYWLAKGRISEEQQMALKAYKDISSRKAQPEIETFFALDKQIISVKNALSMASDRTARIKLAKKKIELAKEYEKIKASLQESNSGAWQSLFSNRLNIHPDDLDQIKNELPEGVTLLEIVLMDDKIIHFICSSNNPITCKITSLAGGDKTAKKLIAKSRIFFSKQISKSQTDKLSRDLYNMLIKPVENKLKQVNTKTLLVAPVGQLRYIPFCALNDGKQYLVTKYDIANVTGLDILRVSKKEQKLTAGDLSFIGFANPDGSLPGAEKEIEKLAVLFHNSRIYEKKTASLDNFLSTSGNSSFIHLATHGVLDPNNPALSYILFADGKKLTYSDMVAGIPLMKKLGIITLSACNSASKSEGDGSEIYGMAYQFVKKSNAGATVATLWKIDDNATEKLMTEFYRNMQENIASAGTYQRAKSLSEAQRVLLGNNKTAHPSFWAGFILIGNYK